MKGSFEILASQIYLKINHHGRCQFWIQRINIGWILRDPRTYLYIQEKLKKREENLNILQWTKYYFSFLKITHDRHFLMHQSLNVNSFSPENSSPFSVFKISPPCWFSCRSSDVYAFNNLQRIKKYNLAKFSIFIKNYFSNK